MNDYEIDQIRLIRHQISAEHGHDLRKVAEYYRRIENELRDSGEFRFADENDREPVKQSAKVGKL